MPVIAVAPCRSMADYQESIRRAGGELAALALDGPAPPAEALAGMHGLLLTGGGDVEPSLVRRSPRPGHLQTPPSRGATSSRSAWSRRRSTPGCRSSRPAAACRC